MPNLPAVAGRVGSSAVPTPQRIIDGGHPGYAFMGRTRVVPIQDQIYGLILPRQGFPSPHAVAGASVADSIRLGSGSGKGRTARITGRSPFTRRGCPPGTKRCPDGHCTPKELKCVTFPGVAGASMADAIRLASGGGKSVAGSNVPPSYPDYPGNQHRAEAVRRGIAGAPSHPAYPGNGQRRDVGRARGIRGGMAGSNYPPSYPDYPGNPQRRDSTRGRGTRGGMAGAMAHSLDFPDAVRHGFAGRGHVGHHHHGHGGACCDSCAHGGPCEGCDGHGGCGKPNCGCN